MRHEAKSELSSVCAFPASILFICITIGEDGIDNLKRNIGLKLALVLALLLFTFVVSAVEYSYLGFF